MSSAGQRAPADRVTDSFDRALQPFLTRVYLGALVVGIIGIPAVLLTPSGHAEADALRLIVTSGATVGFLVAFLVVRRGMLVLATRLQVWAGFAVLFPMTWTLGVRYNVTVTGFGMWLVFVSAFVLGRRESFSYAAVIIGCWGLGLWREAQGATTPGMAPLAALLLFTVVILTLHGLLITRLRRAHRDAIRASEESEAAVQHALRLDSIAQMAGGVAHEFNNLLGAISMHAELIAADGGGGPATAEAARTMETAVRQGTVLTTRLLAMSEAPRRP